MFFNERFVAARYEDGCHEKFIFEFFLFAKDYRPMTSGWQRAPYSTRYGRGLVSKPSISLKKSRGGYRRMTTKRLQPESLATPKGGSHAPRGERTQKLSWVTLYWSDKPRTLNATTSSTYREELPAAAPPPWTCA